jgi:hypothetical protein
MRLNEITNTENQCLTKIKLTSTESFIVRDTSFGWQGDLTLIKDRVKR